jgi:hypothetical protein
MGLGRTLSLEGREDGISTNCLMPIARSSVQKYPYMPPQEMLADSR